MMNKVDFRKVPDRDSKYMGLAWWHAAFSKDPNTQVGAQIVAVGNRPLGSGYNGPPKQMKDADVPWHRPANAGDFCKYDVVVHAEINAIDHSDATLLDGATLYVTGFPCPACMKDIIRAGIKRVVYFEQIKSEGSMLKDDVLRQKTLQLAKLGGVQIEEFAGDLSWITNWAEHLKTLGVLKM